MSERLQVVTDDAEYAEYAEIEPATARQGGTVSHWARETVRRARRESPDAAIARKLDLLSRSRAMDGPTGDTEQLSAESARGDFAGAAPGGPGHVPPVFLDAHAPIYLAGGAHPDQERADHVVTDLLLDHTHLVTDAGVFRENLHRYPAINRPAALVLGGAGSREAIQLAVTRAHQTTRDLFLDRGFDRFPDLRRLAR